MRSKVPTFHKRPSSTELLSKLLQEPRPGASALRNSCSRYSGETGCVLFDIWSLGLRRKTSFISCLEGWVPWGPVAFVGVDTKGCQRVG